GVETEFHFRHPHRARRRPRRDGFPVRSILSLRISSVPTILSARIRTRLLSGRYRRWTQRDLGRRLRRPRPLRVYRVLGTARGEWRIYALGAARAERHDPLRRRRHGHVSDDVA